MHKIYIFEIHDCSWLSYHNKMRNNLYDNLFITGIRLVINQDSLFALSAARDLFVDINNHCMKQDMKCRSNRLYAFLDYFLPSNLHPLLFLMEITMQWHVQRVFIAYVPRRDTHVYVMSVLRYSVWKYVTRLLEIVYL